MLRRQVPDIVEQASCMSIKATMTTNGTLVDKVRAKRLVEAGLRGVNILIDSPVRKMHEKHPCYAAWTRSLIDFNGDVYVCCMTRERMSPLGNLKHQSFREIWESAAYRQIRLKMHPPALAACKRCDDFVEQNKAIWESIGPY